MTFGKLIESLIKRKLTTATQISHIAVCAVSTVYRWKRDKAEPSLTSLQSLCMRLPNREARKELIRFITCPMVTEARPHVVTLCGSARFQGAFDRANFELTLRGYIVLSIGCNTQSDEGALITIEQKLQLDELHKRKIDLSDSILVLNVDGYIGASTRSEIEYAKKNGVRVDYLVPVV